MLISTCPLLSYTTDLPESVDLVVQYLHEYPVAAPLSQIIHVRDQLTTKYKRIVFVTAYNSLHQLMQLNGIESLFIPMTIDAQEVRKHHIDIDNIEQKRVVYFGNLTGPRMKTYKRLKVAFESAGWKVDLLSSNRLNGYPIDKNERWEIISGYSYGIGVGRSALEMMSLGLKVMIAGNEFGGIITNDAEFENHKLSNFGGGVTTFSRKMHVCVESFDQSIVRTIDIHDELPHIEQTIRDYLQSV